VSTSVPCRTLNGPVHLGGRGLFTGAPVRMTVSPRETVGIVFRRIADDADPAAVIEAPALTTHTRPTPGQHYTHLLDRASDDAGAGSRPTVVVAMTIEHVVAALAGLSISHATVELNRVEVPMMDGSSRPLVEAIGTVGIRELAGQSREPLVIRETIRIGDAEAWIEAGPSDATAGLPPLMDIEYRLDYGPGSPIQPWTERFIQYHQLDFRGELGRASAEYFATQIAPARTFNTLAQAESLRRAGLFQHLTFEDVLVIGPDGPVGTSERFEGEAARHKLLDMIGDLALVGRPIVGRIRGHRSGHALNHQLAAALLATDRR